MALFAWRVSDALTWGTWGCLWQLKALQTITPDAWNVELKVKDTLRCYRSDQF